MTDKTAGDNSGLTDQADDGLKAAGLDDSENRVCAGSGQNQLIVLSLARR